MPKDYVNWTLIQLKNELKRRKARCGGRKQELVARLQALDIMHGEDDILEVEYRMELPDAALFTEVHASSVLPPVSMDRLQQFLKVQDKEFDSKCQLLYEQRYVRFIRSATAGVTVYITASIWAEMKKAVSYKVDVAIDEHGVPTETQCECAAGQGPTAHCKHVACLLYAIVRLQKDGFLLIDMTCTQKLQTFHRPSKPHTGSPIKSTAIVRPTKQSKRQLVYDPRPESFRNQSTYPGFFRNMILNFPDFGKMPVAQLYEPANPYISSEMHNYGGSADKFFEHNAKLSSVSASDRVQLEITTRGQANNKLWVEERMQRITASHFGEICKATAKKDLDLLAKNLTVPKQFDSRSLAHGRLYEPIAVKKLEELMGLETVECGLIVHKDLPWLAASPDRLVGNNILVEIKCPYTARNMKIDVVTVPYLRRVDGHLTLDRNHCYYYQVQGQLACTDREICFFCVFTFVDILVIAIRKDRLFIKDMVCKLKQFYRLHFKPALLEKHVYKFYSKHF